MGSFFDVGSQTLHVGDQGHDFFVFTVQDALGGQTVSDLLRLFLQVFDGVFNVFPAVGNPEGLHRLDIGLRVQG